MGGMPAREWRTADRSLYTVDMLKIDHQIPDDAIDPPERSVSQAMLRGFCGRCPHCGKGRLFRAFLKTADRCTVCGEDFSHQRADDAPAYFVILIVGHLVVPLALEVEIVFAPPYWVHVVLWLPLILALALGLLQPVKGAIVGLQWAQYMHGFSPHAASVDCD
jgi:uncharacterized protein (DUF983 family)